MICEDMAVASGGESDQVVGAVVELAICVKELLTEGSVINDCELAGKVLEGSVLDSD